MKYAGFWKRFAAALIDSVVLFVAVIILTSLNLSELLMTLVEIGIGVAYYAGMESSEKQATLGKLALGIKVINYEGGRISFPQALGRYFAKILSVLILLVGYIMVAFTEKKQGLHDILAKTLVVESKSE